MGGNLAYLAAFEVYKCCTTFEYGMGYGSKNVRRKHMGSIVHQLVGFVLISNRCPDCKPFQLPEKHSGWNDLKCRKYSVQRMSSRCCPAQGSCPISVVKRRSFAEGHEPLSKWATRRNSFLFSSMMSLQMQRRILMLWCCHKRVLSIGGMTVYKCCTTFEYGMGQKMYVGSTWGQLSINWWGLFWFQTDVPIASYESCQKNTLAEMIWNGKCFVQRMSSRCCPAQGSCPISFVKRRSFAEGHGPLSKWATRRKSFLFS